MPAHFRLARDNPPAAMPFGTLRTLSSPPATGASKLTVIEGVFDAGQGHAFHMHPEQEELMIVLEGTVEQWLDGEKRNLSAGDAAFIPAGVVHATYNVGDGPARLFAIFGPCVGDGFTTVDKSGEAPWKDLRV